MALGARGAGQGEHGLTRQRLVIGEPFAGQLHGIKVIGRRIVQGGERFGELRPAALGLQVPVLPFRQVFGQQVERRHRRAVNPLIGEPGGEPVDRLDGGRAFGLVRI